jgi:hypothetical protein
MKKSNEQARSKAVGRPNREDKDNKTAPSTERGTKPGEMRKTYVITTDLVKKIEAISFWDSKSLKEVINEALTIYVRGWEKKHGPVKMPGQKP